MTDKLDLDAPVLLPEVPDAADACVGRLVSTLSAKPGVDRAHVVAAEGATPARLCIHFDPAVLPRNGCRLPSTLLPMASAASSRCAKRSTISGCASSRLTR